MWKKLLKFSAIGVVVVFAALQFYRPDMANPEIAAGEELGSSTAVPEDVAAILNRSCVDCHSNRTRYPWYSQISPVNWFLVDHINEGRHEMNFSVWNTYSARKKERKLGELCEQVETREMPLSSYLLIHRDAALSDSDIKTLCDWAIEEKDRLEKAPAAVDQTGPESKQKQSS